MSGWDCLGIRELIGRPRHPRMLRTRIHEWRKGKRPAGEAGRLLFSVVEAGGDGFADVG